MSRAYIDLGYTHEMASIVTVAPAPTRGPRRIAGGDLIGRLACLKSLEEAERNSRLSFCTRMAIFAQGSRRRMN